MSFTVQKILQDSGMSGGHFLSDRRNGTENRGIRPAGS